MFTHLEQLILHSGLVKSPVAQPQTVSLTGCRQKQQCAVAELVSVLRV